MSDKEKIKWMLALLYIWGTVLWTNVVYLISGGHVDAEVFTVTVWFTVLTTVPYLLILSWRTAYLSGRKKR